jgi:hypothetical protein
MTSVTGDSMRQIDLTSIRADEDTSDTDMDMIVEFDSKHSSLVHDTDNTLKPPKVLEILNEHEQDTKQLIDNNSQHNTIHYTCLKSCFLWCSICFIMMLFILLIWAFTYHLLEKYNNTEQHIMSSSSTGGYMVI